VTLLRDSQIWQSVGNARYPPLPTEHRAPLGIWYRPALTVTNGNANQRIRAEIDFFPAKRPVISADIHAGYDECEIFLHIPRCELCFFQSHCSDVGTARSTSNLTTEAVRFELLDKGN
jgi:hypothetical protein